jgi:citrate lyase beta subunit
MSDQQVLADRKHPPATLSIDTMIRRNEARRQIENELVLLAMLECRDVLLRAPEIKSTSIGNGGPQ